MLKVLVWLLGMPEMKGKSGKRETAALIAVFTFALLVWSWGDFTGEIRSDIIKWLLSLSALLLMLAFGFEAFVKQAGFNFGPGVQTHIDVDTPDAPSVEEMQADPKPGKELE